MIIPRFLFAAALSLAPLQSVQAQDPGVVDTLDDIVVTARRSGAPIWRIQNGESVVILVGAIHGVPRQSSWKPDALVDAVAQADAVILSQSATMTMASDRPLSGWMRTSGLSHSLGDRGRIGLSCSVRGLDGTKSLGGG